MARGPRHQTVAHLGKLGEREQRAHGWNELEAMLGLALWRRLGLHGGGFL